MAELLAIYIRNCQSIKGLNINDNIFTISQLADDTTIFVQDTSSIKNLLCVMDRFYETSGLRLNKQKSAIFILSSWWHHYFCIRYKIHKNVICVINRFYETSGLRLNKQKSEIFILGSCGQSDNTPNQIGGLKCTVEPFKALGVYFGKDEEETHELNFTNRLSKCNVALNIMVTKKSVYQG